MKHLIALTLVQLGIAHVACAQSPGETAQPGYWPETKAGADGVYVLKPSATPEAFQEDFETYHGSYGSLVAPKTSSVLAPQGNNTYDPSNLDDDSPSTAWVEGVDGYGKGEWIEFTVGSEEPAYSCGSLVIVNGYQKSKAAFEANSRVKTFDVLVEGKKVAQLQLLDQPGEQAFKLPVKRGTRARLVIADVYPGTKYKDTAVTEMFMSCAP